MTKTLTNEILDDWEKWADEVCAASSKREFFEIIAAARQGIEAGNLLNELWEHAAGYKSSFGAAMASEVFCFARDRGIKVGPTTPTQEAGEREFPHPWEYPDSEGTSAMSPPPTDAPKEEPLTDAEIDAHVQGKEAVDVAGLDVAGLSTCLAKAEAEYDEAQATITQLQQEVDIAWAYGERVTVRKNTVETRWISLIADIREAAGVGCKPMLDELPSAIRAQVERANEVAKQFERACFSREEEVAELKQEVERLKSALGRAGYGGETIRAVIAEKDREAEKLVEGVFYANIEASKLTTALAVADDKLSEANATIFSLRTALDSANRHYEKGMSDRDALIVEDAIVIAALRAALDAVADYAKDAELPALNFIVQPALTGCCNPTLAPRLDVAELVARLTRDSCDCLKWYNAIDAIAKLQQKNERLEQDIFGEQCSTDYVEAKLELKCERLQSTIASLRAALDDLVSDCDEYSRINNLHNADGSPATNHAMRRARAALKPQGAVE